MAHLIAHRGASAQRPENTIASIQHAIDLGADYVEIDVHFSKDLIPVVIHDPSTARTAGMDLIIAEAEACALKNIDVGSWFDQKYAQEAIPFLKDVLKLDFKNTKLMIEIKNSVFAVPEIVNAVLNCLDHKSPSCLLGSFEAPIIREIQRRDSMLPTIGIVDELADLDLFLEIKTSYLAINHEKINADIVAYLRSKNVAVWTFTVDDVHICQNLLAMQLDGIITNQSHAFLPLFR